MRSALMDPIIALLMDTSMASSGRLVLTTQIAGYMSDLTIDARLMKSYTEGNYQAGDKMTPPKSLLRNTPCALPNTTRTTRSLT